MIESSSIKIREVTLAEMPYLPQIHDLLERTQGRNIMSLAKLQERVVDPLSYPIMALDGKELIGFAYAQVIQNFDYYTPFDPQISEKLAPKKVGSFAVASVREEWQGKGIGRLLANARLDWLRSQKCELVVGVSWVSGNAHTSNRVFEKSGFKAIKKVEGFYLESSVRDQLFCPTCRQPPCSCAAIFYMRDL